MTIRWMNAYGTFRGTDSLKWELTQKQREVSAEWTIKGRPYILPREMDIPLGLIVKSKAVIKRTRCDMYTTFSGGVLYWQKERLHKKLNPNLFNSYTWEAVCYPEYAGIVIVIDSGVKKNLMVLRSLDKAIRELYSLFMYVDDQIHRTSYEILESRYYLKG